MGLPKNTHYRFHAKSGELELFGDSGKMISRGALYEQIRTQASSRPHRLSDVEIDTGIVLCLSANEPVYNEVMNVLEKYQTPIKTGETQ